MSDSLKLFIIVLIEVLASIVRIETVTVSSLCPTNKVAPHKRAPRYENNNARTFGAYYDLLTPGNIHRPPSTLQEKPQSDEPDDCGEIEDYDENDLSSITPQPMRRAFPSEDNRSIFGWLQTLYEGIKITTTQKPPNSTPPPYKPSRPPTGGYFGNNYYSPPQLQEPTNNVKPVYEAVDNQNIIYRPDIVGVPNSQIIGLPQVMFKPTIDSFGNIINRNIKYSPAHAIATNFHSQAYTHSHTQKPNRARKLNSNGILSSFLDLFH